MERSYMHNDIINLLNIEDKDIVITKILIHDRIKEIYLEKAIKPEFCPSCFAKESGDVPTLSVTFILMTSLISLVNISSLPILPLI